MKIDEFKKYLIIDKHQLDDEIVKQAQLFYTVAEAHAEAVAERDAAKELLAEADAIIDRDLRKKAGEKLTEPAIKHRVQMDTRHVQATNQYFDAKLKAEKLNALREAFKDRSFMLRELAGLFQTSYYDASTLKPTGATDHAVYEAQRRRIAADRERRSGQ